MTRVLFSPIGGTDPIRNNRDGSMLHICRYYKPDVVYLYLSKEMYAHHTLDNRYVFCIEALGKQMGHHFDVHLIVREDLSEVQSHEVFYDDFRSLLVGIRQEMQPDDELLVNIASGTPAMKNALVVLSVLGEVDFKAIQVSTPLKTINRTDENVYPFEADQEWDADDDNYKPENRCTEVKSNNLAVLIRINIIRQLLARYDYPAVCLVSEEIRPRLTEDAYLSMQQALARLQLDYKTVSDIAKVTGYNPVPIRKSEDRKIVEYLLALQVKEARGAYDDFIRSLSPAIVELFRRVLFVQCHVNIDNFTYEESDGAVKWGKRQLEGSAELNILNDYYAEKSKGRYTTVQFKYGNVYSEHLLALIAATSTNRSLNTICSDLRLVEEKVRNRAAHQTTSITQGIVTRWTGFKTNDIMQMIRKLASFSGLITDENIWNSYLEMNKRIEGLL